MNIKNSSLLPTDLSENTKLLTKLLEEAKVQVKDLLQKLATSPDFDATLQTAFGLNIQINSLQESWTLGEFVFPEIEIVNRNDINNANGAFARDTNKIYLAQEFLLGNINNLNAVTNVLLEEYGHFVDSQLNSADTPGDEGAIFAALVQGKELSEEELQQLKSEDDSTVVVLDGKEVAHRVPYLFEIEQNNPGDTLATAQNIGVLSGEKNLTDAINSEDATDIYEFSLSQTSRVTLDLDGLNDQSNQRYLDMELIIDLNNNGLIDNDDILYSDSINWLTTTANITSTLGAANYFIRLNRRTDETNTNYNLTLDATAVPLSITNNPDDTLATANNLGVLEGEQNFTGFIGTTDTTDIYQFSLAQTSRVTFDLERLTDQSNQRYLDMELIIDLNNNGLIDNDDILYSDSINWLTTTANITSTLGAANYFIRLNRRTDETNTNYNLTLDATAAPASTTTDPGKTLATAYNLGVLEGEQNITEFIGTTDEEDIYQFSLTETSRVDIKLEPTTNQSNQRSLDMELVIDRNNNGLIDSDDDLYSAATYRYLSSDSITSTLGAANYFVRLSPRNDETNTNYNLSLSAESDFVGEPDPRTINLPSNDVTDLDPIRLEVAGGDFTYNEQTKLHEASGIIFIGRTDGIEKQLRVDGKVSYDDGTIFVDGTVYSVIGDNNVKTSPLFKGKFELDIATVTTKSFEETDTLSDEYEIAGLGVDFSKVTVNKQGLGLGAKIDFIEAFDIPDFFFSGSDALLINEKETSIASSSKFSLPNFKDFKLGGFLPIKEFSDFSLEYIAPEDIFKIQGKLVLPLTVGDVTIDLAEENYLEVSKGKLDVKGVLELEGNTKLKKPGFNLDKIGLLIDTKEKEIGGTARISFPPFWFKTC